MGLRAIYMPPEMLARTLVEGNDIRVAKGLPDDSRLVDVFMERVPENNIIMVVMIFESKKWATIDVPAESMQVHEILFAQNPGY